MRAVLVEGFERIHRSNWWAWACLPLQFRDGESIQSRLDQPGTYSIHGLAEKYARGPSSVDRGHRVTVARKIGSVKGFPVRMRIDARRKRRTTTSTAASSATCCAAWRRTDTRKRSVRAAGRLWPAPPPH
ncbi:MAG: hypothetical protein R3F17_01990 [Planctomycetota bacterium]